MSWPDDWTRWGIDEKGNTIEISDTQRYKMAGNGVVSNVVKWIIENVILRDWHEHHNTKHYNTTNNPPAMGCNPYRLCNSQFYLMAAFHWAVWLWPQSSLVRAFESITAVSSLDFYIVLLIMVIDMKTNLLEDLAELEHQQWAHWTKYMLDRLEQLESEQDAHDPYKDCSP